jgi:hypothetical protein
MDIETKPGPDGKYELCYVPVTVGDWIGANCAGNDCEDDASQPFSYECFDDNDCNSLDAGECGVAVCEDYICITKKKTDARQTCDALASSSGYQCSDFASCTNDVGTRWDCNFNGYSFLCGQNGHGFDVGCSGSPDYQCNVQLCLDASENPCSLCYSQCLNAANDPNRSPSSSNSCVKNGYWAQCGGG